MASVTIYHDLASTFSYPALELLYNHPTFTSTPLHVVPIFLGGVFQTTGNKPPPMIPAKREYLLLEFYRKCRKFSIPVRPEFPKKFPINSMNSQRAAVAVGLLYGEQEMSKVVREMGVAFWGKGEWNPEDKGDLEKVVAKILGSAEKAKKVMEIIGGQEVKAKLTENTQDSVKKGAFGGPWMVVKTADGKEVVAWGVDALDVVAEAIGKEWPPRDVKASL
ncbi:thioredoxin-like protein [Ascodesmis nigricans]|uniref:Glutathione S-transferase kappa n=1 Tax=Ascodesmis nigricans TaxID=341454 RepID=A0A4S2MT28_9PEZI|nr:thioredoxin-like protein [Ascodesmis nigricans]